ncbi:hypothetical protein HS088_TW11G00009 [Tripterygium wilfordii]|uniref:Uncharacterized protein n=1 Tax=Tripterygium wilfordii TaxID=458696 RepID=A0A7J7D0S3_TRIWF|nr:hypothetical protein HS088_TW11G00009 [Tripterygium wilfordii]
MMHLLPHIWILSGLTPGSSSKDPRQNLTHNLKRWKIVANSSMNQASSQDQFVFSLIAKRPRIACGFSPNMDYGVNGYLLGQVMIDIHLRSMRRILLALQCRLEVCLFMLSHCCMHFTCAEGSSELLNEAELTEKLAELTEKLLFKCQENTINFFG